MRGESTRELESLAREGWVWVPRRLWREERTRELGRWARLEGLSHRGWGGVGGRSAEGGDGAAGGRGPAGRGQGAGRRDLGKIRACSWGAKAGDLETKEETKGPGVWEGHRQAGLGEGCRGTPNREGCGGGGLGGA